MDIRLLQEFILFAKNLNVTKSAEQLHMAPSSLSRHIDAIERELDVQLVGHRGTRLYLTQAGKALLETASAITAEYDGLLAQLAQMGTSECSEVSVAYALDDRTSVDAISMALAEVRQTQSGVSVRTHRTREASLLKSLEKGSLDLAVLYCIEGLDTDVFRAVPFWKDHVIAALPLNDANRGRTEVHPEEIMGCTIPWPSGAKDNWIDAVMHIFDGCPTRPSIHWVDADNMDVFFMHLLDEREVWLFSENHYEKYRGSIPVGYLSSIVPCRIVGVDSTIVRYAVHRWDHPNKAVSLIADALSGFYEE